MKEYRIIESRPVTQCWEYLVEAENETEALNKVLDGEIEPEETWTEDNEEESDYEIEEAE